MALPTLRPTRGSKAAGWHFRGQIGHAQFCSLGHKRRALDWSRKENAWRWGPSAGLPLAHWVSISGPPFVGSGQGLKAAGLILVGYISKLDPPLFKTHHSPPASEFISALRFVFAAQPHRNNLNFNLNITNPPIFEGDQRIA